MPIWNNTDEPTAYLITFRTYGTWLAGDERGSIDNFHNKYGGPHAVPSPLREQVHLERLKSPPFLLNAAGRALVESAIREVCQFRHWLLMAFSLRTNHAHAVLRADSPSGKMLNDLKSYSTRKLREYREWTFEHSPWVDKGSRRNLWTDVQVERACDYVINGQGGPLPEFEGVTGRPLTQAVLTYRCNETTSRAARF